MKREQKKRSAVGRAVVKGSTPAVEWVERKRGSGHGGRRFGLGAADNMPREAQGWNRWREIEPAGSVL